VILQRTERESANGHPHAALNRFAGGPERLRFLFLLIVILGLGLAQSVYLAQIGQINGRTITALEAALIASSNWLPYLPIYVAVRALCAWRPAAWYWRPVLHVPLVAAVLIGLGAWHSFALLAIVPSGHAFQTIFGSYLRTGLVDDLLGLALLYGLAVTNRPPARTPVVPRLEVRDGARILLIPGSEIHFIEAEDYYVRLHTGEKSWLVRRPLYEVLDQLKDIGFVRISRSAIVSLEHIQSLKRGDDGKLHAEFGNGRSLPVAKGYRKTVGDAWRVRADPMSLPEGRT